METLDQLIQQLDVGKAKPRDAASAQLRARLATETLTPAQAQALADFVARRLGRDNMRYTWRDAVELLVAAGPALAAPVIPTLRAALAAVEDPWATINVLGHQKIVAARALIALTPETAAADLAPWLGDRELLLGKVRLASEPTTLDHLVALGSRAAAVLPALRRRVACEGDAYAKDREAAAAALAMLVPQVTDEPPFDPLDPRIAAEIARLGGVLPPYEAASVTPIAGVPESIRRLADVRWPARQYENKADAKGRVKHIWVWMLQWLGVHVDAAAHNLGWERAPRSATLAHADGGNYTLHVIIDHPYSDPLNPIVFKTDHDPGPGERVANGMTLLEFLRTLKPAKKRPTK
ncbi:MAG: hypothetical protein K8W52_04565 [Deltaproteobacteria bacterium]|nr:hypothetical protein [Deltaproteobacteria bacterium]